MSFDEQFDELAALAHRTAHRILGSQAEAEEVAQEVMVKALLRWRRIRSHARPWVGRVAVNESIGILRKRRDPRLTEPRRLAPGDPIERLDLQRALLRLPRRQREVLVLRYLLDLSETDAAAELGVSVGTVKAHAHRALATLRAEMTPVAPARPQEAFDV